jgi:flagellar operon protein
MSEISPTISTAVDLEARIAAQNQRAAESAAAQPATQSASAEESTFAAALRAANRGITLSGHAQTRLASRQIDLTDKDLSNLSNAMTKAAAKGAKSSLVLLGREGGAGGQVGLVVSIPNRTVITAVDTQALKDNIFTNIDSAMII